MFGKEKDDVDSGAMRDQRKSKKTDDESGAAPSIISADMKVVGDLQSGGDVQIEGSVEGDIKSRTVTIGENAQINGSVNADTASILGRINGKINAATVRIAKSANVQGDINYQTLSIEEGAVIDGQIKRNGAGGKGDSEMKSLSGDASSDANVASLKPSMIGGDGKSPAVSAGASGMKSSGSKPLAG